MNTEKNQQAKNGGNLNIELEVKKSGKANLEQNKFLWLLMGCVIVFSVTFAVIEWTTFEKQEKKEKKAQQQALDIPIDILVPFTVPEKKVVPPPPEAKKIVDIKGNFGKIDKVGSSTLKSRDRGCSGKPACISAHTFHNKN